MRKILYIIVILSLFIGCDKLIPSKVEKESKVSSPIKGTLLAQVNDWAIGTQDFNERLNALKTMYPDAANLDATAKKKVLEELINLEILSQVAAQKGLTRDKDVVSAVRDFRSSLLAQKLREQLARDIIVTDAEIDNFYKQNQAIFQEPQERKIREIVVKDESQAKDVSIRLLQGESFAFLARSYSIAKSKAKDGDLGYITPPQDLKGGKFQKFWEAAFTTEKGDNSSYFKGPDGYYIVKVEDIRGGKVKALGDVRENIKAYLQNLKIGEKTEETIYNAKKNFKVIINDYLIE